MKSPLKSEGREERNGQTDMERETEGEWGGDDTERQREREGHGEKQLGVKKIERLRGMIWRERDHQKGLFTQNTMGCVKCLSKSVCQCEWGAFNMSASNLSAYTWNFLLLHQLHISGLSALSDTAYVCVCLFPSSWASAGGYFFTSVQFAVQVWSHS